MDRSEIDRYLHATVAHHICVDVRDVAQAPGYLRLTTIYRGHHPGFDIRVIVEFVRAREYVLFDWESDLRYIGEYPGLDEAVADLESFLETPIARWTNYTAARFTPSVVDERAHERVPRRRARAARLVRNRMAPPSGRGDHGARARAERHPGGRRPR